ncbi:MAG: serine/threonine-protein kinase, partial [Candidatus Krumholzibacteria bacterium]|nr:serine/threonine-protein kinase [Candidatus Krumholzibacteria bacterium]
LVYEAEQLEPIKRKVALKMVKRGLDTEEFIARFESERQALAMMDHPCIARVFDAGATEHGRPYFVMEYVDGIQLNDYCDEHRLTVQARLELFILVCEGVQHAHQKAIIHRDLKPSNVLVTVVDNQPMPKIIDFGVAKAMDTTMFDNTMTTGVGQLVGTPEYMSPEQADMNGGGIDTRTDVYALGVLLYELLVGKLPFTSVELKELGFKEVLRTIKEVEPPKPSTRLGTIAKRAGAEVTVVSGNRKTDPSHLRRALKGDLDWITMKALEKERDRRYETANALALDIGRHLTDRPVVAGPPSTTYRMQKFVRRNRTGVIASGVLLVAVLAGILGTTTGMIRAVRAEKQARVEAETARQVSDFLVDLFEVSDPGQARGNSITAREILDAGAGRIESELADQPLTQARLMNTIGTVYRNLGLYEEAGPKLEAALALRLAQPSTDRRDLAISLVELGDLYMQVARYDEAEKMLNDALELMRGTELENSLEVAQSLNDLASVQRRLGHYDKAEPLYLRARDIRIARLGPEDPEVARSYNSLAILNWNRAHYEEAEALYKKSLALWEKAYGSDHADVAKGLNNLALLYHHLDRYDDAKPLYERAVVIYEKVLGPDHPRLAVAINNLALFYFESGEYGLAEPLYRRALDIRQRVLGSDHPEVAQTLNNLGNLNRDRGEFVAADEFDQRALAIREKVLGAGHPDYAWTVRDMALLMTKRGDPEQAAAEFERAIVIFSEALAPEHPYLSEV